MWWLLWSVFFVEGIRLASLNLILLRSHISLSFSLLSSCLLSSSSFFCCIYDSQVSHLSDPMKETGFVSSPSCGDPRIRFKHGTLLEDYQDLQKETELKKRKLETMKQKRLTLIAEVRFLRRRYKHLKQDQSLETSPEMIRLSESGDLKVPSGKRKNHFGLRESVPRYDLKQKNTVCNEKEASCDLEKKLKRSRGNEVLTNSIQLPDLNGDDTNREVSGFDLNQISREEDEPEANGEHMVAEETKNAMLGNGVVDLHGGIKLPNHGDVEKGLKRAVKRKVTWQEPVALRVWSLSRNNELGLR